MNTEDLSAALRGVSWAPAAAVRTSNTIVNKMHRSSRPKSAKKRPESAPLSPSKKINVNRDHASATLEKSDSNPKLAQINIDLGYTGASTRAAGGGIPGVRPPRPVTAPLSPDDELDAPTAAWLLPPTTTTTPSSINRTPPPPRFGGDKANSLIDSHAWSLSSGGGTRSMPPGFNAREISPAGSLQAVLHKAMRTPPTSKTTPPAVRPPTVPSLLPSLPEVSKSLGRMPMTAKGTTSSSHWVRAAAAMQKQSASLGKIGQ